MSKKKDVIFTSPRGGKYEGEYKDGIPNGQGTYTSSNGEKYEGEWKDEKPWNGTYYDKDGNIIGKFMNGWFDQKSISIKTTPSSPVSNSH